MEENETHEIFSIQMVRKTKKGKAENLRILQNSNNF